MLTPMDNGGISYNLETLKEVAFLTRDYHNHANITTTVNNYL